MSNEFNAICRRVAAAPPSQLRTDALDLIGAQRAQALLAVEMAATAQLAQNECAALRQALAAATARAETAEADANELRAANEMNAHYARRALDAEAKLAAVPVNAIRRCFVQEYDDESQWASDTNTVQAWLAQSEVQP